MYNRQKQLPQLGRGEWTGMSFVYTSSIQQIHFLFDLHNLIVVPWTCSMI